MILIPKTLPLFSRIKISKSEQFGIIKGVQAHEFPVSYLVSLEVMPEIVFWVSADDIERVISQSETL